MVSSHPPRAINQGYGRARWEAMVGPGGTNWFKWCLATHQEQYIRAIAGPGGTKWCLATHQEQYIRAMAGPGGRQWQGQVGGNGRARWEAMAGPGGRQWQGQVGPSGV